jgi:CRP-like cAMP-binding protein
LRQLLTDTSKNSGFDAAAIVRIVEHAQVVYYEPDEIIARAAKVASISMIILSGIARLTYQGARTEPMIVRFVKAGEPLASFFERGTKPAFNSIAHTHCGIALVPHEVILSVVGEMPAANRNQFTRNNWMVMSDLLRDKCELLTLDVRGRLIRELSILARHFGVKRPRGTLIDLPLKQDQLAQLVVVDRSTLNRKLRELETEGLLFRSEGRYVVAAGFEPTATGLS